MFGLIGTKMWANKNHKKLFAILIKGEEVEGCDNIISEAIRRILQAGLSSKEKYLLWQINWENPGKTKEIFRNSFDQGWSQGFEFSLLNGMNGVLERAIIMIRENKIQTGD